MIVYEYSIKKQVGTNMLYKYLKDTNVYFRDLVEVDFLQILFFVSKFYQKMVSLQKIF